MGPKIPNYVSSGFFFLFCLLLSPVFIICGVIGVVGFLATKLPFVGEFFTIYEEQEGTGGDF
jgi:hypothetical protein